MNKLRACTFALAMALPALSRAQADRDNDETYLRKSEADWAESVASGDAKVIERILADDFVGIDPKGKSYDKAVMIAETKAGPKSFAANHLDDVKIRFYGDTAVAQGRESWVRQTGEKGRFIWTDTWLRRNGRWQIVAAEDLVAPPLQTPEEEAIKARRARQNEAILANKIDEIASFWTDDVTICRGLGVQLSGKAAYRKLFEEDTNPADKIVYQREPRAVEARAHWPLAFETGTWTGRQGDAKGPAVLSGRYSAQWVKRDGTWLIRSEVFVATGGSGPGLQMKAAP